MHCVSMIGGKPVCIVDVCSLFFYLFTENFTKNNVKVVFLFSLFFFLSAGSGRVFNILVV